MQITEKCLQSIFRLQHLEDLVLEGCFGIDDDSLEDDVFKQGCKTLKVYRDDLKLLHLQCIFSFFNFIFFWMEHLFASIDMLLIFLAFTVHLFS